MDAPTTPPLQGASASSSPAPVLVLQIVRDPDQSLRIVSPLPLPMILEIFIDLLPQLWTEGKKQAKAHQPKLVKSHAGLMDSLRNRMRGNGRIVT